MKINKIIICILSAIMLASCAGLYAEGRESSKEKSHIEQHASELLLLSQEVLSAEKLYEKRSDLSEFGGECGQDGYKRVCDKMYEIKRGLIKLEETCTNRFYRERAEAYISSKMRALLGREEE